MRVCVCVYIYIYIYTHTYLQKLFMQEVVRLLESRPDKMDQDAYNTAISNWERRFPDVTRECMYVYAYVCIRMYVYVCLYKLCTLRVDQDAYTTQQFQTGREDFLPLHASVCMCMCMYAYVCIFGIFAVRVFRVYG
jgi:hypothetical protein